MSESCLLIRPSARNDGIRRESGIGMSAREAVGDVDTLRAPADRSTQISTVTLKQLRQATNDTNEYRKKIKPLDSDPNIRKGAANNKYDTQKTPKTKPGSLYRSGHVQEEDQQQEHSSEKSTSVTSSAQNSSLPQHEQIRQIQPLDITYCCTPASLRLKEVLVSRLSEAASTGRIQVIDLSRRGLGERDAELIRSVLRSNPQLAVLKLGDNKLGDKGASIIAPACSVDGRHHQSLTVLDLGFNSIGDQGVANLSLHMIAGNHVLRNLYLTGNDIKHTGAVALAGAILHGCSLRCLHLSANKLGTAGIKVLAQAVAEMDARRHNLLQRQGGIVIAAIKPPAIEELHIAYLSMQAEGFATLARMLISNTSLQTLCLANNEIDDRDMALLSQALAQNKGLQLKAIQLSFNKITCVGIECFMNAIWGSQTMKEIKIDNNKIQDRGVQLCAVVLGSVNLEVLDIGYNRVSTVGLKGLMKSLSENSSLRSLSLCGIPMDQIASKAVSYALAYNPSLEVLNVDSCCPGYSGQRYIVAGIVSNHIVKLRTLTGFTLRAITETLGLPQFPEDWGNDRVLSFVRYMWSVWRSENHRQNLQGELRGPAPPKIVAASGKKAWAALCSSDAAKLQFEEEHAKQHGDSSPITTPETSILVRSKCGQNLQIPAWHEQEGYENERWSETDSIGRSSYTGSSRSSLTNVADADPERRDKNLQWLQVHFQSLNEVGNLAFKDADLWQLHQHFFSPAYGTSDENEPDTSVSEEHNEDSFVESSIESTSSPAVSDGDNRTNMGRSLSFKAFSRLVSVNMAGVDGGRPNKRGSLDEALSDVEPCKKRAKNLKPRIAYYPRIREKLESLGKKPSAQTLSLLRRLKYIESVLLQGKNIYTDNEEIADEGPNALDVEMILLDLL